MSSIIKLVKDVALATAAIALSVLAGRFIGLGRWAAYMFRQWPDLFSIYTIIFFVALTLLLTLALDLQKKMNSVLFSACLGFFSGAVVSFLALGLAQIVIADYRQRFFHALELDSFSVTIAHLFFAFMGTFGWLYGTLAAAALHGLQRLTLRQGTGNRTPTPL